MAANKYELPCDEHPIRSHARARHQTSCSLLSIRFGLIAAVSVLFAYSYGVLTQYPVVKLVSSLDTTGNGEGDLGDTAQATGPLDKRQVYQYSTTHAKEPHTHVTGITRNHNAAVETSTEWAVVTITHTPSGGNMTTPNSTTSASVLFSNTTSVLGEADTTVFVTATVFPEQPPSTGMFSSSVPHSTGAVEADTTVFVTATVFPEPALTTSTSPPSASLTITSSEDSGADVTVTVTATVIPEIATDTSLLHSGLISSSPCAEEMSSTTAITSSMPVWTTSTLTSKLTWSLSLSGLTNSTAVCHETASDVLRAVTASATIDPRSESAPTGFVSSVDATGAGSLTTTDVASVVALTVTETPIPTTAHMTLTVTDVNLLSRLSSPAASSSPPLTKTKSYSHTTTSTTEHLTSVIATTTLVAIETTTLLANIITTDDGFSAVAVVPTEQCAGGTGPIYTQTTLITSTIIFVTGPAALAPTATETVTITADATAGHPGISSTIYYPDMDTTTTTTCTNTDMATVTVTASGPLDSSVTTLLIETIASTDGIAVSAPSPSMGGGSTNTPPSSGFSIGPFTLLPSSIQTSTVTTLTNTVPLSTAPTLISSIFFSSTQNSTTTYAIPALSSSYYSYLQPSSATATASAAVVVISDGGSSSIKNIPRIPATTTTTYWGGSNGCGSATCAVMLIAAAVVGLCNIMV